MKLHFVQPPSRHHVLGKSLLELTHQYEAAGLWPVGLPKPPPNWGTAKYGKLGAHQVESIGKKSLMNTLVLQWGYPPNDDFSTPEAKRHIKMLWNYADRVKASSMAHNLVASHEHSSSYEFYAFRYHTEARKLYPSFAMRPSNHVGLHYGDVLRNFGPSHAIQVPGFERLNYVLQSMNTNHKLGAKRARIFLENMH